MQGMDISAPQTEIVIGGKTVTARFDHNAMRLAEIYWQHTTLRRLGYIGIAEQASARTYTGLGAIAYGATASAAMAAGKAPMDMSAFDRIATYGDLLMAAQALIGGVRGSLPAPGNAKKKDEMPLKKRRMRYRGPACTGAPLQPESQTTPSGE